ncbi:MAG: retropepsin-like aspartic protease, partial [Chitinophagaceae bacterium]
MRKGFLFLLLILALSRGAFSQEIAPADTFMWKGVTKDTIPIELINGSLIVKVSIAGSAYRFIFDTGATLSISENLFLRAHFKSKSHQVVQDATGHIDSMKRLMIPGIRLGKFDILNCPANVLDYEKGSFFNCQNIDGMIGGEIFRSCAVEIDLKKKRLIISSQPPNQPLAANEFPVFFDEQFSPLFNIKINNAYDLKV